ncbi:alpha/beta hydrolase family protein [Hymenobacter properus]|uniref:Alpha/beta fold hydrolase n=1 Tax=Hymenobacter properus TaxID=2791026 RepID=A0A931BK02_9BACT|nr:alpha/beta fold hydrolase [Hymenobacter properus]MBF9142747.1 alpha/beta fold hydrolase [Hymenobacter properus]MBR7721555.1 alpha/beta fold hydrolase [Microvirga sp. SRT04]
MEHFVGYRELQVTDPELNLTFPLRVLYPSPTPSRAESVGPYTLDVAREAPISPGGFRLVLVSHGTGGSGLVYRNLAHHLARHGFVVGLPEHPHNNRDDDSWAHTPQNLRARPRHLQLCIDALLQQFPSSLKPSAVGLIGHSMGGYTALALAGGQPTATPRDTPDWQNRPIPVPHDERVKALVLLAPATPWFMAEGALRAVRVPILLMEAEKDEHTTHFHTQVVLNGVPDQQRLTHRVVPNAGHFAFLSPFPAARVSAAFPPSQDPPGFDRLQFHEEMNAEVLAFLTQELDVD